MNRKMHLHNIFSYYVPLLKIFLALNEWGVKKGEGDKFRISISASQFHCDLSLWNQKQKGPKSLFVQQRYKWEQVPSGLAGLLRT